MLWQDSARGGSSKERQGDGERLGTIWGQTMSGEKPRVEEASLPNDLEEERVEASFLKAEPTPPRPRGATKVCPEQEKTHEPL